MNVKLIAIALATAVAMPVMAHHSFGMFDPTKTVVLNGTIKEFQWSAPHCWIQLMAPGPDGKVAEWSIEWRSPNQLIRTGVRRNTFKPGDKVQITINPLRNGSLGGALSKAVLADGTTLNFNGGSRQAVE